MEVNACCEEWKAKLTQCENTCAKLTGNAQLLKTKIIDTSTLLGLHRQLQAKLKESAEELAEAKKQSANIQKLLETEKREAVSLKEQVDFLLASNAPTESKLEETTTQLEATTAKLAEKEAYVTQLEASVSAGKEALLNYDKVVKEAARLRAELCNREIMYRDAKKSVKFQQTTVAELRIQVGHLTNELDTANNTILSLELELSMLKDKKDPDMISWESVEPTVEPSTAISAISAISATPASSASSMVPSSPSPYVPSSASSIVPSSDPIDDFAVDLAGDLEDSLEVVRRPNMELSFCDEAKASSNRRPKSGGRVSLSRSSGSMRIQRMGLPAIVSKEPSPETSPPHKRTIAENRQRISRSYDEPSPSSLFPSPEVSPRSPSPPPTSHYPPSPPASSPPSRQPESDFTSTPSPLSTFTTLTSANTFALPKADPILPPKTPKNAQTKPSEKRTPTHTPTCGTPARSAVDAEMTDATTPSSQPLVPIISPSSWPITIRPPTQQSPPPPSHFPPTPPLKPTLRKSYAPREPTEKQLNLHKQHEIKRTELEIPQTEPKQAEPTQKRAEPTRAQAEPAQVHAEQTHTQAEPTREGSVSSEPALTLAEPEPTKSMETEASEAALPSALTHTEPAFGSQVPVEISEPAPTTTKPTPAPSTPVTAKVLSEPVSLSELTAKPTPAPLESAVVPLQPSSASELATSSSEPIPVPSEPIPVPSEPIPVPSEPDLLPQPTSEHDKSEHVEWEEGVAEIVNNQTDADKPSEPAPAPVTAQVSVPEHQSEWEEFEWEEETGSISSEPAPVHAETAPTSSELSSELPSEPTIVLAQKGSVSENQLKWEHAKWEKEGTGEAKVLLDSELSPVPLKPSEPAPVPLKPSEPSEPTPIPLEPATMPLELVPTPLEPVPAPLEPTIVSEKIENQREWEHIEWEEDSAKIGKGGIQKEGEHGGRKEEVQKTMGMETRENGEFESAELGEITSSVVGGEGGMEGEGGWEEEEQLEEGKIDPQGGGRVDQKRKEDTNREGEELQGHATSFGKTKKSKKPKKASAKRTRLQEYQIGQQGETNKRKREDGEVDEDEPESKKMESAEMEQHPIISSLLFGISRSVEIDPPLSPSLLPDDPIESEWETDKEQKPNEPLFDYLCRRISLVFAPPSPGCSLAALNSCDDLFNYDIFYKHMDMVVLAFLKVLHECNAPSKVETATLLFWQFFSFQPDKGLEFRNLFLNKISEYLVHSASFSSIAYMCELFATICKSNNDLERFLFLAYKILRKNLFWKIRTLAALAQCWPDPLIGKGDHLPLLNAIENLVALSSADQSNPEHQQEQEAYQALRRACYWPCRNNPEKISLEVLVSDLMQALVRCAEDPDMDAREGMFPRRMETVIQAFELLSVHKAHDWDWTYQNIMVPMWGILSPTYVKPPNLTPAVLRLLGIVGRVYSSEQMEEVRSRIALVFTPYALQNYAFNVQVCAALSLFDLCKGNTQILAPCKEWYGNLPRDKKHQLRHLSYLVDYCTK